LLAELVQRRRGSGDTIVFVWVKGHSGDPLNHAADRLAAEAAREQHPRCGDSYTPAVIDEEPIEYYLDPLHADTVKKAESDQPVATSLCVAP
jgi:hypothetical protein